MRNGREGRMLFGTSVDGVVQSPGYATTAREIDVGVVLSGPAVGHELLAYIRQCFPTAAVLVMSVSDRSVKSDSGFVPMDSAQIAP